MMSRSLFDQELASLKSDLEAIGNRVALTLEDTIAALSRTDLTLARRIADSDLDINQLALQLEQDCIDLIVRQQPLAQDLRLIIATSKITTDLERIADQCVDVCGILLRPQGLQESKALPEITQMFSAAANMLRQAIVAYRKQDAALAKEICRQDDAIDADFARLMLELSGSLSKRELAADQVINYILVVKYIERIADHVTNFAEWTIFIVTGMYADLNFHDPSIDKYN